MRLFNQLIILSLIIFSCQNSDGDKIISSHVNDNDIKRTAAIVVEGMSCEMACVSSINKTLTALEGTSNVDIHFDAEQTLDTCYVDYDKNEMSAESLVRAIQKCNGGIYKVKSVDVTGNKQGADGSSSKSSSQRNLKERDQVKYSKFTFPSVLDLIKSVGF